MKKTDIANGISYLEIPEVELRILCGCPENSIKYIMQKGLTPKTKINGLNLVSGPNSILLNDITILNSHFLNFAEFPVLHHQYFQGAAYNGTNEKFLLIGNKDKVDDQYEYIRRGLRGLTLKEEILKANVTNEVADRFIALGDYHRGGNKSFDIISRLYLNGKTQIKKDLYIKRLAINIFEFTYKDQTEIVDINFPTNAKGVGLPYFLEYQHIPFEEFSVTTIGDGNGWNPYIPCMNSMITANGRRFLIDSGPGSLDLIWKLGVAPSEIEGVFLTHSHDDHFAGILSLLNSDSKVKFFSSSLVIASVLKKFHALLHFEKDALKKYIDFIELKEGVWTNIGEMEVKPYYSFHPIETNVFYFRVKDDAGNYKSYGHMADIVSKKDLNIMIEKDASGIITKDWAYSWFDHYLEKSTLKRIDAGGGAIHGNSHDFINDESEKIILSHLNKEIDTTESKSFFKPTDFGHTEVLIPAKDNYIYNQAKDIFTELEFDMRDDSFISQDVVTYAPNEVIYKIEDKFNTIYIVMSGLVRANFRGFHNRKYVKGDFLYAFNNEKKAKVDYIAETYVHLVKLKPKEFYKWVKTMNFGKELLLLRETRFFSYGFSFKKLFDLSKIMLLSKVKKGILVDQKGYDFFLVVNGSVEVYSGGKVIRKINKDQVFVCSHFNKNLSTIATETTAILLFNQIDITKFPSVNWSIFEEMKKIETIVETNHL